MPKNTAKPTLKKPWRIVSSILFGLLLALALALALFGISPEIDSLLGGELGHRASGGGVDIVGRSIGGDDLDYSSHDLRPPELL